MPLGREDDAILAIVDARHGDPFGFLGLHEREDGLVLRTFQPWAERVEVLDRESREVVTELPRVHPAGFFSGPPGGRRRRFAYRLRAYTQDGSSHEFEDAYRFPPVLGALDIHLLTEGNHLRAYEKLGAHPIVHEGVSGVAFAVWAPSAQRVSTIGDFNLWDGRRHPMRLHPACGVWEIFIPDLVPGEVYKYEILGAHGQLVPLKADPCAAQGERPPRTASIITAPSRHEWRDGEWMASRAAHNERAAPISIYEVHLGSWRRRPEEGNRYLTYRELAEQLVPYAADLGFTHLELLPIAEFPFDGSWGYQPTGLFAPTSRFGAPDDFRFFVDACHRAGLALLLDWVPGHFPTDPHGLGRFDGTALYEHEDWRQGFHKDWNTLIYNFGRREVANFLLSSALSWYDRYHLDGIRVDAVASMLYLDYSRPAGEWIPNRHVGRENL